MSPLSDGFITHTVITEMTNKLLLDWNLLSWEEGLECVNPTNPTAEVTKEFVQHRHVRECLPGNPRGRWQTKEFRYHRYNSEAVQRMSPCVKTLDKESLSKGSETRIKAKAWKNLSFFLFFFLNFSKWLVSISLYSCKEKMWRNCCLNYVMGHDLYW